MIGQVIVTPEQGIELKKMGFPQPVDIKEGQFYVLEEHVGNGVFVVTKEKYSGLFKMSMLHGNVVDAPLDRDLLIAYLPTSDDLVSALARWTDKVQISTGGLIGERVEIDMIDWQGKSIGFQFSDSSADAAFWLYKRQWHAFQKQYGQKKDAT